MRGCRQVASYSSDRNGLAVTAVTERLHHLSVTEGLRDEISRFLAPVTLTSLT